MLKGMSGPLKMTDHRRPIVEPGGPAWPWSQGGRDLDIGQSAQQLGAPFKTPTIEIGPAKTQRRPRLKPPAGSASRPPGVLAGLIPPVVGALALFHAAPHIGAYTGAEDLLLDLARNLPFGDIIAPAARAWAFAPFWVWAGALGLRALAMGLAKKAVVPALGVALVAFLLEAGAWLVSGPAEGEGPLTTLLLVEGAILLAPLILLWLFDRQRRRQEV